MLPKIVASNGLTVHKLLFRKLTNFFYHDIFFSNLPIVYIQMAKYAKMDVGQSLNEDVIVPSALHNCAKII